MPNAIKKPAISELIFVFVLCVFFILVGLSNYAVAEGTPLFPQLKPWDLQSLKITDNDGRQLSFNRKMCVWTLAPEDLATNEVRVTDFADQIIGLTYQKAISDSKPIYTYYMVAQDSFGYKLDISLPEGKTITLYLGSDDNAAIKYVRTSADKNVYLLSEESINNITMNRDFWLPDNDST